MQSCKFNTTAKEDGAFCQKVYASSLEYAKKDREDLIAFPSNWKKTNWRPGEFKAFDGQKDYFMHLNLDKAELKCENGHAFTICFGEEDLKPNDPQRYHEDNAQCQAPCNTELKLDKLDLNRGFLRCVEDQEDLCNRCEANNGKRTAKNEDDEENKEQGKLNQEEKKLMKKQFDDMMSANNDLMQKKKDMIDD